MKRGTWSLELWRWVLDFGCSLATSRRSCVAEADAWRFLPQLPSSISHLPLLHFGHGIRGRFAGALPQGEASAWDELFDLHYAAAGRFIFQLSPDFSREDTEEICQEVFLSVIKNLESFEGQCQFQTWLFRIAMNRARDFREKRLAAKRGGAQNAVSLQEENPETGLTIDPPDPLPAPDEMAMNAEQMAMVRATLDQLEEPCREIVELRYLGDLSYEELGATLKLNPKTVSSRLSRCLDRLEEIAQRIFLREKPGVFPSN